MNELIKITQNDKGERVVSARDLHEYLGSKQQFTDWIRNRINTYGFIENHNFISFHKVMKRTKGASTLLEYALTLDTAKEIAMLEGNEKGRRIRQYFIAVEKEAVKQLTTKLPAIPKSFAEALELAAKQQREIESQHNKILELTPKAEFADKAILINKLTSMSMAVKLLKFPLGRNRFLELLRYTGVFFKNTNEPMQKFIEAGYFQMKQRTINRTELPDFIVYVPYFTEKGMLRMSDWLKKRGYYDKNTVWQYILAKRKEAKFS